MVRKWHGRNGSKVQQTRSFQRIIDRGFDAGGIRFIHGGAAVRAEVGICDRGGRVTGSG